MDFIASTREYMVFGQIKAKSKAPNPHSTITTGFSDQPNILPDPYPMNAQRSELL